MAMNLFLTSNIMILWKNTIGIQITTDTYQQNLEQKKLLQLHKLITNTNGDKIIDHINRDKKDNRKENLRVCTARENCINRGMLKNNTSGTMGVCFDKSRNKWTATIVINNKNKHLGRYENIEDAIIARLKAELKYFRKEFAPQRHLFKEYGIK